MSKRVPLDSLLTSRLTFAHTLSRPRLRCACNRTLQELVDRDGEQLKRAGEISLDPGVEVLALGTDRQDKTPAVSGMRRWQSGGGRVEA